MVEAFNENHIDNQVAI